MILSRALPALVPLLLVASCSTAGADHDGKHDTNVAATANSTRIQLQEFSAKYGYDTDYLEQLLGMSPAAYSQRPDLRGIDERGIGEG